MSIHLNDGFIFSKGNIADRLSAIYKKCMNKFKLTLSISIQLGIWYNNYISKDIYKYQTN